MDARTTENPETGAGLPPEPDRSYTPPSDGKRVLMKGAPREEFAARSALSREPLTRTERLLITMFVTMFAAMLGAGALGFTTISGQLLGMQEQIGGLRTDMQEQIGELRMDMQEQIGELRMEMHDEIGELSGRLDEFSGRLDEFSERLGELSERLGGLSERMARVETLIEPRLIPQQPVVKPG